MRDWGHASDYVEGMWLMTQSMVPSDYVLATGECHTVREFVEAAFSIVGLKIAWKYKSNEESSKNKSYNIPNYSEKMNENRMPHVFNDEIVKYDPKDEIGVDQDGVVRVRIDSVYYRPTEVDLLLGDASKAKEKLGWVPRQRFIDLVREMVLADVAAITNKNEIY
jgi:GDPmannose 4,6-dehydratase